MNMQKIQDQFRSNERMLVKKHVIRISTHKGRNVMSGGEKTEEKGAMFKGKGQVPIIPPRYSSQNCLIEIGQPLYITKNIHLL